MISAQAIHHLHHLHHLSQQINQIYQNSRLERIQLAQWEDDRPFSILGELELLASTLQGYVGQVTTDSLTNADRAMADLKRDNPFEVSYVADWYFTDGKVYPMLSRYLELLDYLRLSLLMLMQQQSLQAA